MERINFEEYRQPWETGPHWELKREFLDRYQDIFTIDRLLCLAQAYSNVELLQCSYPIEVMKQIQELSKPLKGHKHFRNKESTQEDNARPSFLTKRSLNHDDEPQKKFKFIKFQSSNDCLENNINETEKNNGDTTGKLTEFSIDYLSIIQSKDFKLIEKLSAQVQKLLKLQKHQPSTVLDFASKLLDMQDHICYNFSTSLKTRCEFYVGTTLISAACGTSVACAKIAVDDLALESFAKFQEMHTKGSDNSVENPKDNIAIEETSLISASSNKNENCIPQSNSADLLENSLKNKSFSDSELTFLLDFAKRLKMKLSNKNISDVSIIHEVCQQLRIQPSFSSNQHADGYLCVFSIGNISISECKATKKKKAKTDAANLGLKNLLNLLEQNEKAEHNKSSQETYDNRNLTNKEAKSDISKTMNETCEFINRKSKSTNDEIILNRNSVEITGDKKSDQCCTNKLTESYHSNKNESQIKPYFILNKKLFENSINRQFVLFNSPFFMESTKPKGILHFSAQQCHKSDLNYNVQEHDNGTFRCDVLLGNEIIASGCGSTKDGSKDIAALSALNKLQKEVYTVQIKEPGENTFVINRNEILSLGQSNSKVCDAVSEDNIGRKMLKMMGWSGGGIGKKEGITEPIMAQDHNFNRGLGYQMDTKNVDDLVNFKRKIDSILRNFSNSGSIDDLIFSTDFTKDERSEIHRIALKYNLRNQSYGKGAERYLCIRRKVSIIEILNTLLKRGGSTDRYEFVNMSF